MEQSAELRDVMIGFDVPLRFTAVFRRENGDGKIIQSHGSFGVANEESFGDIPT